jgi:Protein of unknown function (DUF3761)
MFTRIATLIAAGTAAVAFGSATPATGSSAPLFPVLTLACEHGYYEDVNGTCVEDPGSDPRMGTAVCRDGTYSHSQHCSGTCSGHGGVQEWLVSGC